MEKESIDMSNNDATKYQIKKEGVFSEVSEESKLSEDNSNFPDEFPFYVPIEKKQYGKIAGRGHLTPEEQRKSKEVFEKERMNKEQKKLQQESQVV